MDIVTVWSDIGCPWSHAAVWRLHDARARLGLEGRIAVEHRPFPLELVNSRPTTWPGLWAEIPVVAALAPAAGWQRWSRPPWEWPVTTLPALEAVQAARRQGHAAAEQLDLALRAAFFGESACISLRPVILDVAARCPAVDREVLAADVDSGVARRAVIDSWQEAVASGVPGSPHVVLPDGEALFHPGVSVRWLEPAGRGFPVVDADDPSVYEDLLRRAVRA